MVDHKNEGFLIFGGIQDITHEKDDTYYFNYATEEWTCLDKEQTNSHVLTKGNSQGLDQNDSPTQTGSRKGDRRRTTFKAPNSKFSPPLRAATKSFATESSPTRAFSPPTKDMSPDHRHSALNGSHINSISEHQRVSPAKSALAQNSIEKKRKAFLMKKQMLLKNFEVTDPTLKIELMLKSPTTEAMKNSITALTYKRNNEQQSAPIIDSPIKVTDSPGRRAKKIMFNTYSGPFGGDGLTKYKIPVDGKLIGQKPCARDGHSAFWFKNKMIVFGGDRHKMSFNDIYILNLDVVFNQKIGSILI